MVVEKIEVKLSEEVIQMFNKLIAVSSLIAVLSGAVVAAPAYAVFNPCLIVPQLCTTPTPTPTLEPSASPTPTPEPTLEATPEPTNEPSEPTGPANETDCSNLDALSEERALNDCGESKVTPTPTPEVVEVIEVQPEEKELKSFPSTGPSLIQLLGL